MANTGIKNKILAFSPYIELLIRNIYWKNKKLLSKFGRYRNKGSETNLNDFNKILEKLKEKGVKKGDILIVHASYKALEKTNLTPSQIIESLLKLVGNSGTLVMNSARIFPEEETNNYIFNDLSHKTTVYNLHESKIWTGVLPYIMTKHSNAVISQFPINPIVAIGRLAKDMTINNLKDDMACGLYSSWRFCADNNAIIVSIGTDLTHSLTMIHTAEDGNENWPVKEWYRIRKFTIVDNEKEISIQVKERKPQWGTLHFAERTLCKDLLKQKIMNTTSIDGVLIETIRAKPLIDYLNSKNSKGYPYFGVSKYLK